MRKGFYILLLLFGLISCREGIISSDPALKLRFSHDTLLFDTVFTTIGSSTKRVMVYNPNKNAVSIQQVSMREGKHFHINLDGENNMDQLRNITVRGGDSLFMFVRVYIDPLNEDNPVLVDDDIAFSVNGNTQNINLQAYGQNVEKIKIPSDSIIRNCHLSNNKPYLLYDTIKVSNLTIEEGSTIYMHEGALLCVYGDMKALGSKEAPIIFRGDRTDRLFDSVPYRMASGQWNGIYLMPSKEVFPPARYQMEYVDILSGSVGLYAYSETTGNILPKLTLKNSRIHNHSIYGLVIQNTDADVTNCEISNCASYCVYLAGGNHQFVHNTIAAYYGYPYTNLNIHQNIIPEDVAAVYINNLSKNMAKTNSSFCNCIITGARPNNLVVATPLNEHYTGKFTGNYLRADSLQLPEAKNNTYASKSDTTVFRNIYYLYQKYHYYDFQLDSLSPARGVADSAITFSKEIFTTDRIGQKRKAKPDAGCYEYSL